MSDDNDTALRRLFAESAEPVEDAAFTAAVAKRVARARLMQRVGVGATAVVAGLVAVAFVPAITDAVQTVNASSVAIENIGAAVAGPLGGLLAVAAGICAVVWVRL